MTDGLTKRQNDLLEWLEIRHQQGLQAPSLDQACSGLGLSSRGSLHKHVNALVKAGYVLPPHGRHLGLRLARPTALETEISTLPFFGRIAAGTALDVTEVSEYVKLPGVLAKSPSCYVLEVQGESMTEAGIRDGDWVVIEPRSQYREGEIVVALIDHSEVTLKRLEYRNGQIALCPENHAMQPMLFSPERVEIQGRLVAQMRTY